MDLLHIGVQGASINGIYNSIYNELAPFHKNARLVIDRGTEYLNNAVLEMLAALGVQVTHPSDGHASHVDRANLSLQRILYQYMDHTEGGTRKWIDFYLMQ